MTRIVHNVGGHFAVRKHQKSCGSRPSLERTEIAEQDDGHRYDSKLEHAPLDSPQTGPQEIVCT